MKTINGNYWKGLSRFAFLALVTVMSLTTVGCGKKSNNNNNNGYYGYGANPNCTNCSGGSALLSSALGERRAGYNPMSFKIGLEFYGQGINGQTQQYPNQQYPNQQYPNQQYPGYSDPYAHYQGMVQAQGRMRIYQGDPQCGIQADVYEISTTQAGQYRDGVINDLIMQAVGQGSGYPVTIRLQQTLVVNSSVASMDEWGRQYPNRLQNDIFINNCRYVIE